MKRTWPPPQVILVGLEPNQQGHAASHEQASSSWPVIFHGVLSFGSSTALAVEAKQKNATASTPSDEGKSDVVFMVQDSTTTRVLANRFCGAVAVTLRATRCAAVYKSARRFAQRSGYKKNQRVTRLELATSSLASRCSTTELHPQLTYENRPALSAQLNA